MNDSQDTKTCPICGNAPCTCGGMHRLFAGPLLVPARGIVLVLLVALALWAIVAAVSSIKAYRFIGSGISPTDTITVSGEGKVFAVADTATFSFTVSQDAKDVGTAQQTVTTKMNDIIAYLKSAGIADTDIQTTDYSANPKYASTSCPAGIYCPQNTGTITGYTVSETVTVKVRDTTKAGDILSAVGAKGVSNVSGLSFTVGDETMLEQQAQQKAIMDAQNKAQVLAKDLGVSLVRVVGFSDNSGGPIVYAKAMSFGAADSAAAPSPANVQLGQNTITSDVNVTYEIQ